MWACVYTLHAHDAFRVVELLPWQVEYVDLHGTFNFAMGTLGTFYRVPVQACVAVLLEYGHHGSGRAYVAAPEPWNLPCCPEEAYKDQYA